MGKWRRFDYRGLLIAQEPQLYQKYVAKVLGIDEACILQQLLYWIEHTSDEKITIAPDEHGVNRKWIYHSAKQFVKEIPWLHWHTIQTKLAKLETGGMHYREEPEKKYHFLQSRQFAHYNGSDVKFYTIIPEYLWDYISGITVETTEEFEFTENMLLKPDKLLTNEQKEEIKNNAYMAKRRKEKNEKAKQKKQSGKKGSALNNFFEEVVDGKIIPPEDNSLSHNN
jgi:hypothetical protein